jgi:hypothetical protein
MDELVALLQSLENESRQGEHQRAERTAVPNLNAGFRTNPNVLHS